MNNNNRKNNYNLDAYNNNKRNNFPKNDNTNSNNNYLGRKVRPDNFKNNFNNSKSNYKDNISNNNNNNSRKYERNDNSQRNYHNNNHRNYGNFNRNNYNNINNYNNSLRNNQNDRNDLMEVEDNNKQTKQLPIFSKKAEILEKIENNRVIIISGNTGCGKSTQVPQYIYEKNNNCKILITQPRRIAAISIANRLSFERNTKLGKLIGYHVSMINNLSPETQIFVKTTGVFLEELLHNNDKDNKVDYTHIIIDEVHERDLYVDLVLVLLKNYFKSNPQSNKKLILMSATIAESEFANYLKDTNEKDVPIIRIKEKWHEVKNFYVDEIIKTLLRSDKVEAQLKKKIDEEKSSCVSLSYGFPVYSESLFPVVAGIIQIIEKNNNRPKNGILIFIPGFSEIQDLQEYLMGIFNEEYKLEFIILHSQVSDDEQEKAFKIDETKRKIILATNIAESSITISNIDYVIDFCLVKQNKFDENQNTSALELKWCSQASCQQRKGRTGRVKNGYYFQLITKDLYKEFKEHQDPEILRTPLETPILKLKIYDEDKEPEIILSHTMNPPSQETIINTIFRLEKMGALTNIDFTKIDEKKENNYEEIREPNGVLKRIKKEPKSKMKYSSGKITKIGEIFALLPIDIKYSRLIVLSFVLGQIDVGITLASILSQERPLFLNSNKCNRVSLYDSKNHYCQKQNCDFIASYIAYKFWCSKYRKDFVNENVDFDTRLKRVGRNYKEIRTETRNNNLDLKVLKEVLRVENDLKKRLVTIGLYSKHFEPKGEEIKSVNFLDLKTSFTLKVILGGTFYNQIFAPEYDNYRAVESDIGNLGNNEMNKKQEELYTIRLYNIYMDESDKFIEIFDAIIKPGKIEKFSYDENSQQLTIKFSDVECIRKIMFITSSALRRNCEIPIFKYVKKEEKEDNEGINRNYIKDDTVLLKLGKEPDYLYNVHYYDTYIGGEIFFDKDSINLTYVVPDYQELKKTKFVTDSYINKTGNSIRKYARYTSLLPRKEMFDKYMMLIFGPRFDMIASKLNNNYNDNNEIYSHYIGFQSYEFIGQNFFEYDFESNSSKKKYVRTNYVKLDYLITNYHLKEIDEIRLMINQMINFRFESCKKGEDLSKEEFDELKSTYLSKSKEILNKIKKLIDGLKVKNIYDKKYEELYNYIQEYNRCNKKCISNTDKGDNEEEDDEQNKEEQNENDENPYMVYINGIEELKSQMDEKDFLQLHEPLKIQGEYFFNRSQEIKLLNKEKKILNIYRDYSAILDHMRALIYSSEPWLCCRKCFKDICSIKPDLPKLTNIDLGEYVLEGAFIDSTLKTIEENKDKLNPEDINAFKNQLDKDNIKYKDLYCCPSGENIIGYIKKIENKNYNNNYWRNKNYNTESEIRYGRYIYYKSDLLVRYPNLTYDIITDDDYKNRFKKVNMKSNKIMDEKKSKEFKNNICCKLCGFVVEKDIKEFKAHLNTKIHRERMEELKKEFLI